MASSRKFLQPINLLNASSDPGTAVSGDFYYNTASQKIRYYDGTQWNDVGTGAGGGITISETAPADPAIGDAWFKTSTNELRIWDGTYWVEATSVTQSLFFVSSDPPVNPATGTGWFDIDTNEFFIFDGTYWVEVASIVEVDLASDPNPTLNTDLNANNNGIDNVDYIDFNTTTTTQPAEGMLVWDDGEGTLQLGAKGGNVNIALGQEMVVLCYNGSGSPMSDGDVVYVQGAQGQRPNITLASAASEAGSSKTLGIVTEPIAAGEEGFVTTFGIVNNVNTLGFTEGAALWLSTTAGQYTETQPESPNHLVFIGYCLNASETSGRIFVEPQNGYEIEELHNVLITSASDNDIVSYESATGLWKNQNLATAIAEVDGTGSGIDADLLDGQEGSYYTGYTDTAIANLIDTAPTTLDTLNELAAALGDDPNFATTVTNQLALKAPLASPALTGTPTAPTATSGTSTTQIATTEFVQLAISSFDALPDQTGNSGKYLTTDGSTTSWGEVDALPSQTGNDGKYLTTDGNTASWAAVETGSIQTDVALSNSWWLGV